MRAVRDLTIRMASPGHRAPISCEGLSGLHLTDNLVKTYLALRVRAPDLPNGGLL